MLSLLHERTSNLVGYAIFSFEKDKTKWFPICLRLCSSAICAVFTFKAEAVLFSCRDPKGQELCLYLTQCVRISNEDICSLLFCEMALLASSFHHHTVLLLLQACVPYFEILEKWIYKGMIHDPYSEVI